MIFRKQDYTPTEVNPQLEAKISKVQDFARKIAPDDWKAKIDSISENMTVIVCESGLIHKTMSNGKLKDVKLAAGAHKFFTDINEADYSTNQGVALRMGASDHVIAHEVLHAFSSETGKTENYGFIKTGAKYSKYDNKGNTLISQGLDLNEAITDALASRFNGKIGPNAGCSYVSQVIMADLLMGENLENNNFIHDVYFGVSENFARDFNKTVQVADVNFQEYLNGFSVTGTEDNQKKADKLLKGAVEYNLRKAKTPEEIEKVFAFQTKVIDFYKNGGFDTGFIEDEEIARLEELTTFAEEMKKQCKSNFREEENVSDKISTLRGIGGEVKIPNKPQVRSKENMLGLNFVSNLREGGYSE